MRLAANARSRHESQPAVASLFEEVYRPVRQRLPAPVADALLALSLARERYRREQALAKISSGADRAHRMSCV